jgi:hypothetical protein
VLQLALPPRMPSYRLPACRCAHVLLLLLLLPVTCCKHADVASQLLAHHLCCRLAGECIAIATTLHGSLVALLSHFVDIQATCPCLPTLRAVMDPLVRSEPVASVRKDKLPNRS